MDKLPLTLRRATAADNELLAAIGAQAFADTFGPDNTPENMAAYLAHAFSPAQQAAELADPRGLFLLAESDGQTAGFAHLHAGPPPGTALGQRPIELARLYALRGFIGRGVGAALMAAGLAAAEQRGCDMIWLGVWEHNPRARAFYARWGFLETGTQSFQLGSDTQRDLVMQRPLAAGNIPHPPAV
jgi:GNAT superfamily N-acetyltransferase